jgi:hypothetical protein
MKFVLKSMLQESWEIYNLFICLRWDRMLLPKIKDLDLVSYSHAQDGIQCDMPIRWFYPRKDLRESYNLDAS